MNSFLTSCSECRKCNQLRQKPQSFFGISTDHMSPSSWESAIVAFNMVASTAVSIPLGKLEALVEAAEAIPRLYEYEHAKFVGVTGKKTKSLGADDLLPIFIYCVVMSNIPDIGMQSLVYELEYICDPQSKYSQVGYFVATFQASIQHLLHMDVVQGESST